MKKGTHLGPVMLDVEGLTLNKNDIRRIRHPLTGGVILFSRNFKNRRQLVRLTNAIRRIKPHILIAVDHEGGRVQRFKEDGFTKLPAMRELGVLYDKNPNRAVQIATATGYVLASELRACGIDLSFTPVLDLDYEKSGVIGNRSFHRNPQIVSILAQSLNYGLSLSGMANCAKHFPGHGYVKADSHVAIPVDNRSLSAILKADAFPYQWLGIGLSAVMPAHVIYPKVDKYPAGFSKKWLTILRKEFKFDGVIFSDDLSMEGAKVAGTVVDAANAALKAGCDMVLVCNAPDRADELLKGLTLTPTKAKSSHVRLSRLLPKNTPLDWKNLHQEVRYQKAVQLMKGLSKTKK